MHNRSLALERFFSNVSAVIGLLRFIGMLNAGVWLGSVIFFTFAAAPAFFSREMLSFLPAAYAGAAAQVLIKRYFTVHVICAITAIFHLIAEWLYTGRVLQRFTLGLLLGMLALTLFGGHVIRPRMAQLHLTMYARSSTVEVRDQARKSFGLWHGVSQFSNLIVLTGLLIYFWQVTTPASSPRFFSLNKFKG